MKAYEGIFIFPPEATPEVRKNHISQLEELIKKFNGNILQKVEMGKRSLGYQVKKFREGFFIAIDFQMDSLKMTDCRKALELQADLLKYMIIVKEKKTEKKDSKAAAVRSARPSSGPTTGPQGQTASGSPVGQSATSH